MDYQKPQSISAVEAVKLIEEARNAELCRNIPASQAILSAVWENLEDEPLLDSFAPAVQAEILRLCGFFLSYYGHSRNLKNYQERGKNFLTKAVEMFDGENLPHKSAEARVMLALCYWYEGAISESELILSEAESEYNSNQLHPVFFQICVNRLMIHYSKGTFDEGLQIIENLAASIDFCADLRLKTMYHNQAGLIYHQLGQLNKSVFHYHEAIENSRKSGNQRFVAINLNNLGFLYQSVGDFNQAHHYVDEAIKFFLGQGEVGWHAHTLDTKAQICLAEEKLATALATIDEALNIFHQGEDYSGLTDSMFTKCRILLQLDRVTEAVKVLNGLTEIANQRVGEFAANKYLEEFSKLVYPLKNTSYPHEVKNFKTTLLRKHLTDSDLRITKAADTLGISHQSLSDILNNQFPELFIELGIRRRSRRNGKKRDVLKNIAPIKLSDSQMSYESSLKLNENASYYTFVLNGKRLSSLKTKLNVVVLVEASEQIAGTVVIMQNQKTDEFH